MDAAQNYVQAALIEKHGYQAEYVDGLESDAQFAIAVAEATGDAHVAAIAAVMYAGLGDRLYDVAPAWEAFSERFELDAALEGFRAEDFTVVTRSEKLERVEGYDPELDA